MHGCDCLQSCSFLIIPVPNFSELFIRFTTLQSRIDSLSFNNNILLNTIFTVNRFYNHFQNIKCIWLLPYMLSEEFGILEVCCMMVIYLCKWNFNISSRGWQILNKNVRSGLYFARVRSRIGDLCIVATTISFCWGSLKYSSCPDCFGSGFYHDFLSPLLSELVFGDWAS